MAFTEQGVAMLSSVLRSQRAIGVNIAIMRTFVKLREMLDTQAKLAAFEVKYDEQFRIVFDVLAELMSPDAPKRHQIGFGAKEPRPKTTKRRTGGNK
jgi:hypothetical protein